MGNSPGMVTGESIWIVKGSGVVKGARVVEGIGAVEGTGVVGAGVSAGWEDVASVEMLALACMASHTALVANLPLMRYSFCFSPIPRNFQPKG